jgi:hypothetical protein
VRSESGAMARLVVLLVFVVIAVALVVALFRDHRQRRDERLDRLRWTFLHGQPLAGHAQAAALSAFVHPAGARFRAPGSWSVRTGEAAAAPAGAGRRVEMEVLRLDAVAGSIDLVATAMRGVTVEGERSVETLANGNVLMKAVSSSRDQKVALAVYTWWLGRARTEGGIEVAVFRVRVPVEAAAEVIVQSDLAVLDREIRAAAFSG